MRQYSSASYVTWYMGQVPVVQGGVAVTEPDAPAAIATQPRRVQGLRQHSRPQQD